jgi:hypothetical protein
LVPGTDALPGHSMMMMVMMMTRMMMMIVMMMIIMMMMMMIMLMMMMMTMLMMMMMMMVMMMMMQQKPLEFPSKADAQQLQCIKTLGIPKNTTTFTMINTSRRYKHTLRGQCLAPF